MSERKDGEPLIGNRVLSEGEWADMLTQTGRLKMAFESGMPEVLHPGNFPILPARVVWIARFWAMDNLVEGLGGIRASTQDPEVQRGLGILMTELISEKDQGTKTYLPTEGPIDEETIRQQAPIRQGLELNDLWRLITGVGIGRILTPKNFPLLRALTPEDIAILKVVADQNRKALLESIEEDGRPIGFGGGSANTKPLFERIREQLENVEGL